VRSSLSHCVMVLVSFEKQQLGLDCDLLGPWNNLNFVL
jgi:hypothetical protein